jgi:hypothetical protein
MMAEAAGLVFAVLGAFNDAVQCFEYIQLARNFDRDFQTATLKLAISKLRLSRWGQSVGLDQVTEGAPVVDSHGLVQAFKKSLSGPPKAHGPGGLRPNRVISIIESSGSQN